jgi:hypothetical protein
MNKVAKKVHIKKSQKSYVKSIKQSLKKIILNNPLN